MKQKNPALAGDSHVKVSITINVKDRDLHPASNPTAVMNNVADPFPSLAALDPFVPIQTERIVAAWIVAIVGEQALSGDQFRPPVAGQIDHGHGVRL